MRCDVNVSIRPYGSETFGTRTEIKNLNSISNVQKALEYESLRQEKVLLSGGEVIQQTMRYDELNKETVPMRSKGDAVDYKYYTEPNILPVRISHEWVEEIKANLPMMARERVKKYVEEYDIPTVDAKILVSTKTESEYFNEVIKYTNNYKAASNWLIGDVQAYLNAEGHSYDDITLNPEYLAKLINFIDESVISSKQAKKVFEIMMKENKDPEVIVEEKGMKQISDEATLVALINEVLDNNPKSIQDYANGKDHAIKYLVGQVMKATKGQANPRKTNELLSSMLKERIN
jgi:aspartyl-tRNA(Asn)/glutamyl-tRNA(Gln) amidotransferase subunit B